MMQSGNYKNPTNQVQRNIDFNIQQINNKIYQMKLGEGTDNSMIQQQQKVQPKSVSRSKLKKKNSISNSISDPAHLSNME